MKRTGFIFEKIWAFDNLLAAYKKAYKGSGRTVDACRFSFNLENELLELRDEIRENRYFPQNYRYFKIYDPKERVISVAPFRDRVVHHAVVRILEPLFEKTFIFDSYATRKGKGTHKAIDRAQRFLRSNRYYLKTDIEKYFDSIDHGILLDLIRRKIKDDRAVELVGRIVGNSDRSRLLSSGKGLPIGNLTSQFFANVYLDPLDHHIKEHLGIRSYIRYMDDLVLFSDDKNALKALLHEVSDFLDRTLALKLHERATTINSRLNGLPFLGFRLFPRMVRVRPQNLRRLKTRLQRKVQSFSEGRITEEQLAMSVRSMFEHLRFADSVSLCRASVVSWAGIE